MATIPNARFLEVEEVADLLAYVSEEKAEMINGQDVSQCTTNTDFLLTCILPDSHRRWIYHSLDLLIHSLEALDQQ